MSAVEKTKNHIISSYPKPFSFELTPYRQLEFNESVKRTCSSSSFTNGLRMCKVIILGDVNVGKTCIVNRFCRQFFNFNYKATIGVDFDIERFELLKIPFNMHIWDTAGQERFRCIASAYYRSAHVIVTVFDLTNGKSLHNSLDWLKEALKANVEPPLKFLVGTKMDLLTRSVYLKVEEQASRIANAMGAEYWAVSSRTGQGVEELFYRIAALSFEKIVQSELEAPEKCSRLSLGQSLLCAAKRQDMKIKDNKTGKRVC